MCIQQISLSYNFLVAFVANIVENFLSKDFSFCRNHPVEIQLSFFCRQMVEDLSKELELQIKGAEKPSLWELLAIRVILLPYTVGKVTCYTCLSLFTLYGKTISITANLFNL